MRKGSLIRKIWQGEGVKDFERSRQNLFYLYGKVTHALKYKPAEENSEQV